MLANQGQASKIVKLLDPVSAANTAAATSGWIDVRDCAGNLMITASVGALTGSITWAVEEATDGSGTGAATLSPRDGAWSAGAANTSQRRTVPGNGCRGWIRLVGTVVTGPALVSAVCHYHPKYS